MELSPALQVWTNFLLAFTALLPLINPLGSSLVFLGLAGEAPPEVLRRVARRIALNNLIFLAVIELLGSAILSFFGLSLPIVQLSGGLVIASVGWNTLNGGDTGPTPAGKRREMGEPSVDDRERTLLSKAFYPFTFPITSGPGTLVAMLTLTAHTSNLPLTPKLMGHLGIFAAAFVLSIAVYLCYANAARLTAAVPPSTAHGILRVMAFILLCIGVQIAWNGLSALLRSLPSLHR
jgi:multiple antibiotic resistance protein